MHSNGDIIVTGTVVFAPSVTLADRVSQLAMSGVVNGTMKYES